MLHRAVTCQEAALAAKLLRQHAYGLSRDCSSSAWLPPAGLPALSRRPQPTPVVLAQLPLHASLAAGKALQLAHSQRTSGAKYMTLRSCGISLTVGGCQNWTVSLMHRPSCCAQGAGPAVDKAVKTVAHICPDCLQGPLCNGRTGSRD